MAGAVSDGDYGPVPVEPPGVLLAEELRARGWTVTDLQRRAGLPWEYWARLVLNDSPDPILTPMSRRLGRALGMSTDFWLIMQLDYDRANSTPAGGDS